jgi:hypothetical protein
VEVVRRVVETSHDVIMEALKAMTSWLGGPET